MSVLESHAEPWNVTVLDTGLNTMTGGRIKRARKYLENERFLLTYGDGVSDVNISELIKYHTSKGKLATITAVMPGGRFGALDINSEGLLNKFKEKKREDGGWINGGFMVLEPEVIDYISGDGDMLENEPFEKMVLDRQLAAFKHYGFWQCMDSMKDRNYLEELIAKGKAPWIKW